MRYCLLALFTSLALPRLAAAQRPCPEGQLVTADTADHCCWPGQAWSHARDACVGVPQCPPGSAPRGEVCAPAAVSVGASVSIAPGPPPAVWAPPPPPPDLPPGMSSPAGSPFTLIAPAQMPTVRVRFVADREGDDFYVSTFAHGGVRACQTPCALDLPPGRAWVHVEGSRRYDAELDVPFAPSVVRVQRFRSGRLVWAVVGLSVGMTLATIGLELLLVEGSCSSGFSYGPSSCGSGATTAGTVLALGGLALGIIAPVTGFTSMGRNRLELSGEGAGAAARRPTFRLAGLGAAPTPGGGASLGAAFTF